MWPIATITGGPWDWGSGSPDITSMSAWHDTVYCAYEYHGGRLYNRYYVSYDGGTTFLYGAVDDTTTTQEKPAIRANEAGVCDDLSLLHFAAPGAFLLAGYRRKLGKPGDLCRP